MKQKPEGWKPIMVRESVHADLKKLSTQKKKPIGIIIKGLIRYYLKETRLEAD